MTLSVNNIKYLLNSIEWADTEHTVLIINVTRTTGDEEPETYNYVSRANGTEKEDILFWNEAMKVRDSIKETEYLQTIKGLISPSPGNRVIDGVLYNDEEEAIKARAAINRELDRLYSGHVLARAKNDALYEANRQRMIDTLLEADKTPDFPYDFRWFDTYEITYD